MKPNTEWSREALLGSVIFSPLYSAIADLDSGKFPTLKECNELLEQQIPSITVKGGMPLRFVSQECGKLPFERQYEPRCYLEGEVPTRTNNWHDLFNALVWLTFPKSKAAINARHYDALMKLDASGEGSQRGAVRDANTLLDESGVVVVYSNAELSGLLRDFKWKELFWQRREQVKSSMGFYIVGHGLYEKALQPYVGMTGQGLLLAVEPAFFSWSLSQRLVHLDAILASHLDSSENCRNTRDLSPVPLLGIPGWTPENENEQYYENTDYFRPGRRPDRRPSKRNANLARV
ncbi:MAG: DUF3025 domain-containing protein [Gallionella sp.]